MQKLSFKPDELKVKTIAAYKLTKQKDLAGAEQVRRGHLSIADVKHIAFDGEEGFLEMEQAIAKDFEDREIEGGRRSKNSELLDSVRSSKDYWQDIDNDIDGDVASRFKRLHKQ